MPYTAFISYSTTDEHQAFIYRLQTLAAASDINVLLPQRNGQLITNETRHRIENANCVIVFLTSKVNSYVREELAYAEGKGKLIIPIYEKGVKIPATYQALPWIEYNPKTDTPGSIEREVLDVLKKQKKEKENKEALILTALGIGLLALILSSRD